MFVPYTFCPVGWLYANGQLLSISQNTALFSLLGARYGGDGRTTFAVPRLVGQVNHKKNGVTRPVRPCIANFGIFPQRP